MKYGRVDPKRWDELGLKTITVNGVLEDHTAVFLLDDQEGWLNRFKRDENGKFYVDDTGNTVAWEVIYGDVKVSTNQEA